MPYLNTACIKLSKWSKLRKSSFINETISKFKPETRVCIRNLNNINQNVEKWNCFSVSHTICEWYKHEHGFIIIMGSLANFPVIYFKFWTLFRQKTCNPIHLFVESHSALQQKSEGNHFGRCCFETKQRLKAFFSFLNQIHQSEW